MSTAIPLGVVFFSVKKMGEKSSEYPEKLAPS